MNFQGRTLLAIALCTVIYVVFATWLRPPRPVTPESEPVASEGVEPGAPSAAKADSAGAKPGPATPPAEVDDEPEPSVANVEVERHVVRNDMIALTLTNASPQESGIVAAVELLSPQFQGHATAADALELGGTSTLAVSFAGEETDFRVPKATNFVIDERGERYLALEHRDRDVAITERFELLDGYEARLTVAVRNLSQQPQAHHIKTRTRVGKGEDSRYDVRRGLCRMAETLEYEDTGDVEDGPIDYSGAVQWGAVDSKYFLTALVPRSPMAQCVIEGEAGGALLSNTMVGKPVTLQPGEQTEYVFGVYIGAKELERLQEFDAADVGGAPLDEAIDWGFFGGLSQILGKLLLKLMRWLHEIVDSWGWSIVLLTVVIKALTLPLTLKQMHSMKRMKEIQPEIAKIKEKYGDDRVKQGQEMQALFARSGVNPLAGCLPMLVQLPVWFALYSMLLTAVELVHQPFLWLSDLTKADPTFLLPLALGGLMIVQNRMMPVQDEAQAKLMRWVMPIMFTVFMLFLPSGLALYIFTNIVLSVIQTAIQMRSGTPAAAAAG